MYNQEDFKNKFTELETWAVNAGYENIYDLENNCDKESVRKDLEFFRWIRNYLTHNPKAIRGIELNDSFQKDFENLCNYFMAGISSVCIPEVKIFKRIIADKIGPTIKIMEKHRFTHVPVMIGKRVWGVFSENTLFNLAGAGKLSQFNEDTTFFDIKSYITEYNTRSCVYDFIKDNLSIEEVKNIFREMKRNKRKLDILFITTTGTKDGDLLGLITIWDIMDVEQ